MTQLSPDGPFLFCDKPHIKMLMIWTRGDLVHAREMYLKDGWTEESAKPDGEEFLIVVFLKER